MEDNCVPDSNKSPEDLLPLTHLSFLILLALARLDLHGYAIIKTVQQHWGSTFSPGTGTFYSALKRMKQEGLLKEVAASSKIPEMDNRRRYYSITDFGLKVLWAEADRLESLVSTARSLQIIPVEGS